LISFAGLAIGYFMLGGDGAVAWQAASGGIAVANEYAQGGLAIAKYAHFPKAEAPTKTNCQ
jgi:hypothetical protein